MTDQAVLCWPLCRVTEGLIGFVPAQMVPMAMYFGYMFIVSYSFFCLTGTIGFFACLMFCKKIYSAVKID